MHAESWLSRHGPYILLLLFLYYCLHVAMAIFGEWFDLYEMLPIMVNAIVVLMAAALLGVVIRVVAQLRRHTPWTGILRAILGQPSWWRTWYPRLLRDPANLWDRLPPTLKAMRTILWLELLVLPAGVVLAIFVLPTFQAVFASLGMAYPFLMRAFAAAIQVGGYVLPLFVVAVLVQARRWRAHNGVSLLVAFNALYSVDREFWQRSDARLLLRS